MTREELKAWLAEIDLAKGEGLRALHAALCVPAPKGSTRGDRSKRRFLRKMVNKRIRQWENRPGVAVYDPWNDPMIIGGHMMPPLSHRYGR